MALKLLSCESAAEVDRVAKEGAAHAALSHRNITRVYDVNEAEIAGERAVYIASEYMPIGDLDRFLEQEHRLSLDEFWTLAADLLAALAYAHDQPSPLLHRDLKPANVLLAGSSELLFKLGDFGVCAQLQGADRVTSAAGTLVFQAPECAFGSYLVESDIYGAAVILYRALTGTYPFPLVQNPKDPSLERAKRDPVPASRFRLDCSRELEEILMKALAPDPFDRYRRAADFGTAIRSAMQ